MVLTRIDDRLIHGQVITGWVQEYPVSKILIIDDELSQNRLMARIYKAASPMGLDVSIQSLAEATDYLCGEPEDGENLLILAKTPQVIESLIAAKVPIDKVILGGMGAKAGRKALNRNVSASPQEVECFRRIMGAGHEVIYQLVPGDKPADLGSML